MKTLSSRRYRLSMFAMLYVVQGIGLAYFRNFQKPYMDSLGISPDQIAILSVILQLPFILKIFIGMLSDSVNLLGKGHRIPYIVIGLVVASFAFLATAFVRPDENLALYAILVTIGSFSVTLFDSSTDGLAIDTTPSEDQGRVQGIMVGGRASAIILLSLLFGQIVQRTGQFRPVFLIIALSMLFPLALVLWVKEPSRTSSNEFEWGAFKALGKPIFLWFAAYAAVYSIASFGVDGLVTYYMRNAFEATDIAIGNYGALRGLGAVIGAIVGGVLMDRVGRKNGALGATLLISVGAAAFALVSDVRGLTWLGLLWGCVWAFQEAVFMAYAMTVSDGRIAASMFAIMMGISNLFSAIGDGWATSQSGDWGFGPVFIVLALLNLIALPVIMKLSTVHEGMAATIEATS